MTFESHGAHKIKVGRAVFQSGPHPSPPFHRMAKSLKDQDTNLFKEKHCMVFGTEGKPIHLFAMCGPAPFLQKHALVLENIMCSGTQQA